MELIPQKYNFFPPENSGLCASPPQSWGSPPDLILGWKCGGIFRVRLVNKFVDKGTRNEKLRNFIIIIHLTV